MSLSKSTILLFVVMFAAMAISVVNNLFGIAHRQDFLSFQHDSEALVIGKIVADKNNLTIPKNAHLGFASIREFTYKSEYIYQSYALKDQQKLDDLHLISANLNDENWSGGVAKQFAGLAVTRDYALDAYVGRKITIDDQSRIITTIIHDEPYTKITVSGSAIAPPKAGEVTQVTISGEKVDVADIYIQPYISQFGIQGELFSKLYAATGENVNILYAITAALLALALVLLTFMYSKIFPKYFAAVFFISVFCSPWLTLLGRNLYWIPFSWFFPAVFAAAYLLSKSNWYKGLFLLLLYVAFVFKCLAGYEYISTIILMAAAPFVYQAIMGFGKTSSYGNSSDEKSSLAWLPPARGAVLVCIIGVLGFITALLFHANLRGDTILKGLQSIYEIDVVRRTYGDPAKFGSESFAALSSSPLDVLYTYIFEWKIRVLFFLPDWTFIILFFGAVLTILYRYVKLRDYNLSHLALFIAFLLPATSWFVLAKGHSGVHAHINFVLWYFGFVAAILYICCDGAKLSALAVYKRIVTSKRKDLSCPSNPPL